MFVAAADLNGDGKPDILTSNYNTGILTIVLNREIGQSSPTSGLYQFTMAQGLRDVTTGDLNGDGLPDIVVLNEATDQVSIFLSKKQ